MYSHCANCKFFVMLDGDSGLCTAHAPVLTPNNSSGQWPEVASIMYCGDWELKEDRDSLATTDEIK